MSAGICRLSDKAFNETSKFDFLQRNVQSQDTTSFVRIIGSPV